MSEVTPSYELNSELAAMKIRQDKIVADFDVQGMGQYKDWKKMTPGEKSSWNSVQTRRESKGLARQMCNGEPARKEPPGKKKPTSMSNGATQLKLTDFFISKKRKSEEMDPDYEEEDKVIRGNR